VRTRRRGGPLRTSASSRVVDAGFPLEATHDLTGGGPSAGELAKGAATTGGIGLGIMLALFLGTGLFALLLAQCGIFDG